jgi:hypothetical protein
VEYTNGWLVKRGEEVGVKAVMNYMLMHLVIGKVQMISQEVDNYVPFGDVRQGEQLSPTRNLEGEEEAEDVPFGAVARGEQLAPLRSVQGEQEDDDVPIVKD